MFSRILTHKPAEPSSDRIRRLKQALDGADAVIIGAGAGLSTSAGFVYNGERFAEHFSVFQAKYSFDDMYSGGFYSYSTAEEHRAYWSRYIWINRYMDPPKPIYQRLFQLVRDKDCFVLTTNVDHCFQKAGFDKKRLFYTQGDYGLFQCSEPHCPRCGKPLTMNLRSDDSFVEDEGWHAAAGRYSEFLRRHKGVKVLLLELGVGCNTPGIIKHPFWQIAAQNAKAVYACISFGQAACPPELEKQSVCIDGDIGETLGTLLRDGPAPS